jgi:hypothetical protein
VKYFLFSNTPDAPSELLAIFKNGREARKFLEKYPHTNSGYVELRSGWWQSGFLPKKNNLQVVKITEFLSEKPGVIF